MTLTSMQATSAPVGALPPATEIKMASRLKRGLRSLGRQRAIADLIDSRRDGQYPAHVDAERLGGDDLWDERAVEFDGEFAPAR